MLSYELRRQKPQVVPPAPSPPVALPPSRRTTLSLVTQQQQPSANNTWHKYDKLQYAKFLNENVYGKFDKGTLVTLNNIPIVLNQAPRKWFEVYVIQEIHYMGELDKSTNEPRCVGIRLGGSDTTIPVYYTPRTLRPLVKSEIEAIAKLRNQEGSVSSTANSGGD